MTLADSRKAAIALAAVFVFNCLLFGANHIAGAWWNGGDYQALVLNGEVSYIVNDATAVYAPGAEKFARSGYLGSETLVYEARGAANPFPFFYRIVVGSLARVLGTTDWAWMFTQAVFPSLIWLWFYCAVRRAALPPLLSAMVAWACCVFPMAPRSFFLLGAFARNTPLEFTRMPHPALSLLCFLAAISGLVWSSPQSSWRPLAAGFLSGLLPAVDYYYALTFFLTVGLWLALSALFRRREARSLLLHALGCSILAGPYYWIAMQGAKSPVQREMMARVGSFRHDPSWPYALAAVAGIAVLIAGFRYAGRVTWPYAVPVLLAVLAATMLVNLHVVTGFDALHGSHFPKRVIEPMGFFLAAVYATHLLAKRRMANVVAISAIVVLVGFAAIRQITVGVSTAPYHLASDPKVQALDWIRDHLPADIVVSSSDEQLFSMAPTIAGVWTFATNGQSLLSDRDLLERFLIASRLEGQQWPEVEAHLRRSCDCVSPWFSVTYMLGLPGTVDEIVRSAHAQWDTLDVAQELQTRRLDYVILPRASRVVLGGQSLGPQVYENPQWRIVQLH